MTDGEVNRTGNEALFVCDPVKCLSFFDVGPRRQDYLRPQNNRGKLTFLCPHYPSKLPELRSRVLCLPFDPAWERNTLRIIAAVRSPPARLWRSGGHRSFCVSWCAPGQDAACLRQYPRRAGQYSDRAIPSTMIAPPRKTVGLNDSLRISVANTAANTGSRL